MMIRKASQGYTMLSSLFIMAIYLTYDNLTLQDGLGAQSLRITGIFAVAKSFGLRYVHSPILGAIEDIGQGVGSDTPLLEVVASFNSFFNFPSDAHPKKGCLEISVHTLSIRKLAVIILKYRISRRDVLIKVLLPMGILDRFPRQYRVATNFLRHHNKELLTNHNPPILVAHVRRGYDEKYANLKYAKNRHLPFSYFSDVISVACHSFDLPTGSRLRVHTDLSRKSGVWRPTQESIVKGYQVNTGDVNAITVPIEGYDLSSEIQIPNRFTLDVRYCDPLLMAFLDMCTAIVLIQGKSALSYLAGIVNKNHIICPINQTHKALPHWNTSLSMGVNLREPMLG